MKTFEDLNFFQREDAIKMAFYSILDSVTCGVIEIDFADDANNVALKQIMLTTSGRLCVLKILAHRGIRKELERLALVAASESVYREDGSLLKEGKENVDTILN